MSNRSVKLKNNFLASSIRSNCLKIALFIGFSLASYAADNSDLSRQEQNKAHSITKSTEVITQPLLDHITISVKDYDQSVKFYDQTLKTLGYERLRDIDVQGVKLSGYGKNMKTAFWIGNHGNKEEDIGNARGFHIAFSASSVNDVQNWYAKCIEFGGRDNGSPGVRADYHPGYYGAFIIDPSGWRIEAVFHGYQEER